MLLANVPFLNVKQATIVLLLCQLVPITSVLVVVVDWALFVQIILAQFVMLLVHVPFLNVKQTMIVLLPYQLAVTLLLPWANVLLVVVQRDQLVLISLACFVMLLVHVSFPNVKQAMIVLVTYPLVLMVSVLVVLVFRALLAPITLVLFVLVV